MAGKYTNQYCIHCLNYLDNLTKDHIFPESWYPDSTPVGMEKWTAPSCIDCNNKLGKIEEACYKILAPCVDKDSVSASGVSIKATRLYNPASAKDPKNQRRRLSNLKYIIPYLARTKEIPINAFLKNYGPKNPFEKTIAVFFPYELSDPFYKKIVRGLEYRFLEIN